MLCSNKKGFTAEDWVQVFTAQFWPWPPLFSRSGFIPPSITAQAVTVRKTWVPWYEAFQCTIIPTQGTQTPPRKYVATRLPSHWIISSWVRSMKMEFLYQGASVRQDLSIYWGVAKLYRGLLYQRWPLTKFFWHLFHLLLPFLLELTFVGWQPLERPSNHLIFRLKIKLGKLGIVAWQDATSAAGGHGWFARYTTQHWRQRLASASIEFVSFLTRCYQDTIEWYFFQLESYCHAYVALFY